MSARWPQVCATTSPREHARPTHRLGTATPLLAIDRFHVPRGPLRWTYLLDAATEIARITAWPRIDMTDGRRYREDAEGRGADMADIGDRFKPGERAPESGFYQCDCPNSHRWSTDVAGHPLPPLPEGCAGSRWTLKERRPVA